MSDGGPSRILVRGAGEIASAIAVLLARARARPALQASRPPIAIRRRMAFSDAAFDGLARLEGLTARRIDAPQSAPAVWEAGEIPLLYCDFALAASALPWDALVDARMNKQQAPERQIGLAPLVIGLGPGCAVGGNVDCAIETSWDDLGRVLWQGQTMALGGEPRAVLGHARDRFRYAPQAGLLRAVAEIGQKVAAGDVIAWVGEQPIRASFDGLVRGLAHDGVPVLEGNKIAEIDPRGEGVRLDGLDERPRRIAEAVLSALGAAGLRV